MIKLKRIREKTTIPGGLRGHHLKKKSLKLLHLKRQKGTLVSKDFSSSLWKPAKPQLKIETHNKCAYCEADTSVVAHGDVEHYRPKTVYWWLAYCYDNYLYSCQICNQVFKSNKFPRVGPKLRAPVTVRATDSDSRLETLKLKLVHDPFETDIEPTLANFIVKSDVEIPLLPNPYFVDPEPQLEWITDDVIETVEVKARNGIDHAAEITKALNNDYGLNRQNLTKLRWKEYRIARLCAFVLKSSNDPALVKDAQEALQLMTADDYRFAGMLRFFVHEIWQVDITS